MDPDNLTRAAVVAALVCASAPAFAEQCCDPASPFRIAEGYPDTPATCETAPHWIENAPDLDRRVSFAIAGEIVDIQWDGALAYLVMCDEAAVQVMCVTYSRDDREIGETVLIAGGYSRVGERQIMLDPCLASQE